MLKMKSITRWAALAALTMLVLPGCKGSKEEVKEELNISADAPVIVSLNVNDLIENAGGTVNGDRVEPGKALTRLAGLHGNIKKMNEVFSEYLPLVNTSRVFVSYSGDENVFITAPIADVDGLKEKLAQTEKYKYDDFDVYCLDKDAMLMIRGGQVWFTPSLGAVTADVEAAEKNSVASHKELVELFDSHTVGVLIDTDFYNSLMAPQMRGINSAAMSLYTSGKYMAISGDLKGDKASMKTYSWDADYKQAPAPEKQIMGTVEASELKVLPEDANVVIALGKPSEEYVDMMVKMLGLPDMQAMMASQIVDGMTGSIVIGAVLPDAMIQMANSDAWHVTVAVGYDKDGAESLMNLATMFGASKSGDEYTFPIHQSGINLTLHFAYINGQIVVSTDKISLGSTPAIARALDGKMAGIAVNLPAGSDLLRQVGITWGIDASATGTSTTGEGHIQFLDAEGGLLENLINLATR